MSDEEREREKDKIRQNPKFYDEKGELKANLSKEEFFAWQKYFLEKEVGCKNFVCVHDSDNCGIYHLCHITGYETYKQLYPERASKCGDFDKVWKGPNDKEYHYFFKEEDWKGHTPKEACLECTGSRGIYGKEITKEEYDKFVKAGYKHVEHFPVKNNEKEWYYFHYHQGWCKEVNDFMVNLGYMVNREWEKYKDNRTAKELLHSLSGGPMKAESQLLKFQIESPKILGKFFKELGLDLNDILGRE